MKHRIKINAIFIFFAVLISFTLPTVFFRSSAMQVNDIMSEIAGISMILLGQLLRVSARGYKAANSQQGKILVQTGPYALVRNPMYLGIILIGLGVVLMLFQWWVLIIFLGAFIIRYLELIFNEERKLLALFPQDYDDYRKTVPRLFPRLKALCIKNVVEYLPLEYVWIKKEIIPIITVVCLMLFWDSWEDIRQEGLMVFISELSWMVIVMLVFILLSVYLMRRTKEQAGKNVST